MCTCAICGKTFEPPLGEAVLDIFAPMGWYNYKTCRTYTGQTKTKLDICRNCQETIEEFINLRRRNCHERAH